MTYKNYTALILYYILFIYFCACRGTQAKARGHPAGVISLPLQMDPRTEFRSPDSVAAFLFAEPSCQPTAFVLRY